MIEADDTAISDQGSTQVVFICHETQPIGSGVGMGERSELVAGRPISEGEPRSWWGRAKRNCGQNGIDNVWFLGVVMQVM